MSEHFALLGPNQRIEALCNIIGSLSPYEIAVAKREILLAGRSNGSRQARFDIVASLPADIVYQIFIYVDTSCIRVCRQVCLAWRQYALSERVTGDYVKHVLVSTCIPSAFTVSTSISFRWLEEREWRWTFARPILSRTMSLRGHISSLATGGGWVALSCDRYLKAWKVGHTLSLGFNIRSNIANQISICPSGKNILFSSFLREAKIYSLVNGQEMFNVRSAVAPISQVSLFYEYAALVKNRNIVDVYKWQKGSTNAFCRITLNDNHAAICGIQLCANDRLVVATSEWNVMVYRIENENMPLLLQHVDMREVIGVQFNTTAAMPKLKAYASSSNPSDVATAIRINMYSSYGYCRITMDPDQDRWCDLGIKGYRHGSTSVTLQLLVSHLLFNVLISSTPSAPAEMTCSGVLNGSSPKRKIKVPRGSPLSTVGAPSKQQIPSTDNKEPDAVSMDDNILAFGYNNTGVSILKFSK